jgi:hypothetical protein
VSLFCRHSRFIADCPICSKGTVLDQGRRPARRASSTGASARRSSAEKRAAGVFSGPHVSAGPFEGPDGVRYTVRLERVPGGVRLAEWSGSQVRPRAPVLAMDDLAGLVAGAEGVLAARDAEALAGALRAEPQEAAPGPSPTAAGVSRGRTGDFREELRIEPLDGGRVRIARWVLRPGAGWELQDAPPMLPAGRYAEALADAVRKGLAPAASGSGATARP